MAESGKKTGRRKTPAGKTGPRTTSAKKTAAPKAVAKKAAVKKTSAQTTSTVTAAASKKIPSRKSPARKSRSTAKPAGETAQKRVAVTGQKKGGDSPASKPPSRENPEARRSQFSNAVIMGIAGVFIGIGGLTIFDRIINTVSNGKAMRTQERQIAAVLQNRDMYTGIHQRKEGLDPDAADVTLTDTQRESLELTDDAIQHCHASLQVDIEARRAWGMLDSSAYASRSLEPQLRDLNFYLPCLMRVNKKRFCDPVQKHDMVLRITAYVGLLDDAREARRRGPQSPIVSRPASMIHKVASTPAEPLPMSFTPSADFADALQDLTVLGLVSKSDFRKPWWSTMPEVIAIILDGYKAEEDACKS